MTLLQTIRGWQNFYMLTGAAAATLIGLLFVAISISVGINLSVERARASLRTFVSPILVYYVQAFIISCLVVMPLQTINLPGVVLLIPGAINIFLALKICWGILVLHLKEVDMGHWIWHFLLPLLAGLLLICVAVGFFYDAPLVAPGLAIAELLCLTIGLRNTWMLTLWLVLHQARNGSPASEKTIDDADAGSLIG